ncbi:MAG: hypothetical protein OEV35_06745 [Gallionellaceae bacterium]|nr:hypothetical protein [Gallionellaceae bacterium]
MADQERMSRKNKIRASAIACSISMVIAVIIGEAITDKVLYFFEISILSLVAIWTIW